MSQFEYSENDLKQLYIGWNLSKESLIEEKLGIIKKENDLCKILEVYCTKIQEYVMFIYDNRKKELISEHSMLNESEDESDNEFDDGESFPSDFYASINYDLDDCFKNSDYNLFFHKIYYLSNLINLNDNVINQRLVDFLFEDKEFTKEEIDFYLITKEIDFNNYNFLLNKKDKNKPFLAK